MMTLNNGATDGQTDPHTVTLCRVERIKEAIDALRLEPHPYILHTQAHALAFVSFGPDYQLPWTIINAPHSLQGVHKQVQYYLLQLDAIARDRREVVGKVHPHSDSLSLNFITRQRNQFSCGLIQIHRIGYGALFGKKRVQSRNHVRRTVAIADRSPCSFARAVDVWRVVGQQTQAGTGVGDDARERLIDLVRNRRRQRSKGRDAGNVCELRSDLTECVLRASASRHVLNRADVLDLTLLVPDRAADVVQVLDRAVWHKQPALEIQIEATLSLLNMILEFREFVGMSSSTYQFEGHRHGRGDPIDSISFFRKEELARRHV